MLWYFSVAAACLPVSSRRRASAHQKEHRHDKKPPQGGPRGQNDHLGPRTPRMVGTVTRARCSNCGAVLTPGFDPNGQCPKCQPRSEEHTSELQSQSKLVCRLLLVKKILTKNVITSCSVT